MSKPHIVLMSCFWLVVAGLATGQNQLENATKLYDSGKTREAIAVLKAILPADPRFADGQILLSKVYLKEGQADSAEAAARTALDKNDRNPSAAMALVDALLAQKRYAEIHQALRKAIRNNRTHAGLQIQLGNVHMAQDSNDLAIVDFSRAKELEPKNPLTWEGLGDVYIKLQGDAIAIMNYEEAVKLDSTKLALLYKLGKTLMRERRYTEAGRVYNRILDLNPKNDTARLELGNLYAAAKMYPNAVRTLAPYVVRKPDDDATWKVYSDAVENGRQYENGNSVAEEILKTQPKLAKALRLAGKSSFFLKKFNESIAHYLNLGKVEALTTDDTKYIGRSYSAVKKDSAGVRYMEQSFAADTTQADLYTDMGVAYMNLKKFDKAASMWKRKFQQDTSYVTAYVNYALCMEQLDKWDLARDAMLKVVQLRPNYFTGHYHLAVCYFQAKRYSDARSEYETATQIYESFGDAEKGRYNREISECWRKLAFINLAEKNYPKALEALDKAVVFLPKDLEMALWRAQTLHSMNRKDEARREYQRVLKLDPKNKDAQQGLDFLEMYN